MAVETQDNQVTDETQESPQQSNPSDSHLPDPPEEQPSDDDINAENQDADDSSQSDPDLGEIDDESSASDEQPEHLERILSMKVPIIVRIAKKKMKVGEIMKLNIGTVIQFDQDAYQHIDLMVNNKVIGLGQPVKIGENFGLKITQLNDITQTIKSLGQASDSQES